MKPSTLKPLLAKLIPAREPVLLVGPPGVGKTDLVTEAARLAKHDLIVMHPVVEDPTDYKGMPSISRRPDGTGAVADFIPFGMLRRMVEATVPTVVFFDDIGQAPNATQAALMQVILKREVNGQAISDQVTFIAATNRRQDKAAVTGLITPLLDRFTTVLTIEFDLDDWITWGMDHDMPPVLMAFCRFKPGLIGSFEASRDMKKSPTPRSVAGLGRLVNQGILDLEPLSGAAGDGFGTEFVAFHEVWRDLPSREDIYMNPDQVEMPTKPNVLFAVMGMLAHSVAPDNFEQTVRYISRANQEFQVVCVKDAILKCPAIKQTSTWSRWVQANRNAFGFDN